MVSHIDESEDEGPTEDFEFSLLEKIFPPTIYHRDINSHACRDLTGADLAAVA